MRRKQANFPPLRLHSALNGPKMGSIAPRGPKIMKNRVEKVDFPHSFQQNFSENRVSPAITIPESRFSGKMRRKWIFGQKSKKFAPRFAWGGGRERLFLLKLLNYYGKIRAYLAK